MYWGKDKNRLNEDAAFANDTTQQVFLQELEDASNRDRIRIEQRKLSESLVTVNFVSKLWNTSQ